MARTAGESESELFMTRRNHLGDLEWIPFQREPKYPLLAQRYSQLRANAQCLQPQSSSLATRRKQEYLLALREELEDEEDDPYSYLYQLPTPGSIHHDTSSTASGSGIGALHNRHSFNCDSISFPDDLDYSFQHGLLNTSLVPSLDNTTTSITLPLSQTPCPSPTSTATVPTTDIYSRVPDKDELPHSSTDIPHKDYTTTALYDENTQTRKISRFKIVQKSTSQFDNSHDASNLNTELPVLQHRERNKDFGEDKLSALQTVPVKKVRFLLGGVPDSSSSRLSTDSDSSQQQTSAMHSLDFPLLFLPRTKPPKTQKRQKKRRMY